MTMFHFKTYTAVTLIGLLAACGGGGGSGGDGGSPRTVFTYQVFDSEVPGDSAVTATGVTRDADSGLVNGTTNISGELDRISRELNIIGISLEDGVFDEDTGTWTSADGNIIVTPSTLGVFANTQTFEFLIPVDVNERGGDASPFIIGIATRTEDLPTDDTEYTFTGVAHVGGILGSDGVTPGTGFDSGGELTLSADFQNRTVNVVIDELNAGGIPFDTVRIADMVIGTGDTATFTGSGAGFITFENNGDTVTPSLGASTTESASGAFFGGDATGPVEAGGAFSVVGENGNTVSGIFAADERTN